MDCATKPCPQDCSSRGRCVRGTCECDEGFGGAACASRVCPGGGSCSDHGVCNALNGTCICNGGWQGEGCEERTCEADCYGHGICQDGACYCEAGWEGEACGRRSCPNGCSARGACLPSSVCSCFDGWMGDDCSSPTEDVAASDGAVDEVLRPTTAFDEMRAAATVAAAFAPHAASRQRSSTQAHTLDAAVDVPVEQR